MPNRSERSGFSMLWMTLEQELVQLLRTDQRLTAMRGLAGGVTATELRFAIARADGASVAERRSPRFDRGRLNRKRPSRRTLERVENI